MAKYSLSLTTITPTAHADTTNLTDAQYFGIIQGGAASMRNKIQEVFLGGQAAASSSPTFWLLSRDSTVGATVSLGTGQNLTLIDGTGTAPTTAPIAGNTATTKPQRSATAHLLNLSFNAYGGLVRWLAAPDEEISTYGQGASVGEVSLSAFTGGTPGACGGHVIFEVA